MSLKWLEGKKTYIGLIASFVLVALGIAGVLDAGSEWFQFLAAVIFTFTGVSFRSAIKNPPTE